MKPLTTRRSAATRPHVLLLIGLALAMLCAMPAEAGRRGRKAKRSKVRAQAATASHTPRPDRSAQPSAAPTSATSRDPGGAVAEAGGEAQGVTPRDTVSRARGDRSGGEAGRGQGGAKQREKVFDFSGFELAGSERMPQLLYFLDRAEEELERASLERRSFVPEMMRSLDEENL